MEENIRYIFKTKDGEKHEISVSGAANLMDAVLEVASSIMHGELDVNVDDIVAFMDIPG